MCVCVFLKFACDVYINTGFNTVRGTEARHIQINTHILHHYRIRFLSQLQEKKIFS